MRKFNLFDIILGAVELYVEQKYVKKTLTLISDMGISASVTAEAENGGIFVKMRPYNAKKIAVALDKNNIIVYINNICGIKDYLLMRKTRVGMLIGAVLFFIMLSVSSLYVFKIEINGNSTLSREEIVSELEELGIGVGTRISEIDKNNAANTLLIKYPDISWAAVNVKGTTVCLEIMEKTETPSDDKGKPEIIVAACDGVIKNITVHSGRGAVGVGSVVRRGDLLINGYVSGSGLQYTDNPLLRFDGAQGSIRAEVSESITETVRFTEVIQSFERGKRVATVLSIFGKKITVGTVPNENFEKSAVRPLTVMGIIELPITYTEYYEIKCTEETVQRDEAQALSSAELLAYEELKKNLTDAQLNKITKIIQTDENGVTVTLNYTCEKEIGVPKYRK